MSNIVKTPLEEALDLVEFNNNNGSMFGELKVITPMLKHCTNGGGVDLAAARIIAQAYRELLSRNEVDGRIQKVKQVVDNLQKEIEKHLSDLEKTLELNDLGSDYLFDYIYNYPLDKEYQKTFSEYFEAYGVTYSQLFETKVN